MIETVLLTSYAIHILTIVFVPVYQKKPFYIYLVIATIALVILWGYMLFELKYCPSYWGKFSIEILTPFLLISTIFVLIRINSELKDKELREYVVDRFVEKFFTKIFITLFLIVVLFQVFLLLSANKAYNEAKKIDVTYVKGKTILDFYRPSLQKPFVKEIYIDAETRWSYHRECYLNEWK